MYVINSFAGKAKPGKFKFEVHICEHCNLNCASCNHFSPLAGESYLNVESYQKDCARISDLTKVELVRLMGGEPLLHPRLVEIVKISRRFFDTAHIEIVTNGILLPRQPAAFWETCKEEAVTVFISKYPVKLDLDAIDDLAKQYGVQIVYTTNIDKTNTWRKEPLDVSGAGKAKTNFMVCYKANNCIQLKDGKLFTCQQAAYINHFNDFFHTSLEITNKDYISIYEAATIDEIARFLARPIPFCRYCVLGLNHASYLGHQWAVSQRNIAEWT
ncbi:MAG: radical SAM protein [Treponema sp.]|jgi:organic radical activating enzyme|nr:radical SAM protein [Treponema sp.]